MSGRYGYKNHKNTTTRRLLARGLLILAIPFAFIQILLTKIADILVDRRRHVYIDREI